MFGWFKKRKEEKARLKAEEERMRAEAEARAKAKLEAEEALQKQTDNEQNTEVANSGDNLPHLENASEDITTSHPENEQTTADIPTNEEDASAAENKKPEDKPNKKAKTAGNPKEKEPVVRSGKWIIEKKAENEFISCLRANNGEIMLTSESYKTAEGARQGIATIIKNVDAGKFIIYPDKKNNYYYKLKTTGNKLLCIGEIYTNRAACENAVARVKLIAAISPISEETVESEQYILYVPDPDFQKAKTEGKWKIVKNEIGFVGKLYASNGELLLATEGVSSEAAVKSGIENVRVNAKENNFVIDRDKNGRYYYKLRNVQKNTLCVGESYETLAACSSAIESVKKFCDSKIINEIA